MSKSDEKLAAALAAHELWRAKEILRGRIGNLPYSPELYEQYGALLLEMQDTMQAGKYLFLSGVRKDQYADAIALFLQRHTRKSARGVLDSFPNRVRGMALSDLPEVVQREILSLGVDEERAEVSLERAAKHPATNIVGWTMLSGCVIALIFTIAAIVTGAPIVVRAIISLFRR